MADQFARREGFIERMALKTCDPPLESLAPGNSCDSITHGPKSNHVAASKHAAA